jgi:hypothetical protein
VWFEVDIMKSQLVLTKPVAFPVAADPAPQIGTAASTLKRKSLSPPIPAAVATAAAAAVPTPARQTDDAHSSKIH